MKIKSKTSFRQCYKGIALLALLITGLKFTYAQNGTADANCAGNVFSITKTVEQLTDVAGTPITVKWTNGVVDGDTYYTVAATGGTLTSINNTCPPSNVAIGGNINVISGANGSITTSTASTITIKAINPVSSGDKLYLGIYTKSLTTSCYSDVFYIEITVIDNIYATITPFGGNSTAEYICSGNTTTTNIGLTICNVPSGITNGTLHYKVQANVTGAISGMSVNGTPLVSGAPSAEQTSTNNTITIGTQTLINANTDVAGSVVYSIVQNTGTLGDNFYYTYKNADGDSVSVPVLFATATDNCGTAPAVTGNEFTVYVAPTFVVTPVAYASDADRTNNGATTTTFCQGTTAYLKALTTTTQGTTTWTWNGAGTDGTTVMSSTSIVNPNAGPLTEVGNLAYIYSVTGTWNDNSSNYIGGCPITTTTPLTLTVNPAPRVLVTLDGSYMDSITYQGLVCPGTLIKIATGNTAGSLESDGIIINGNGANFYYTIGFSDATLKAYAVWRSTLAANPGALPIAHYLDNGGTNNGVIMYNIQTQTTALGGGIPGTNECALVDSSNNLVKDGIVKVKYNVAPRPTFTLTAD